MIPNLVGLPVANNESSEVFDIIKPGRRVKIKGYRQYNVNNLWRFVIRLPVLKYICLAHNNFFVGLLNIFLKHFGFLLIFLKKMLIGFGWSNIRLVFNKFDTRLLSTEDFLIDFLFYIKRIYGFCFISNLTGKSQHCYNIALWRNCNQSCCSD